VHHRHGGWDSHPAVREPPRPVRGGQLRHHGLRVIYVPSDALVLLRLRQIDLPHALQYEAASHFWHCAGAAMIAMVPVWLCDSFALAVGSTMGRHKLARPSARLRPSEGAVAGFVAAILGASPSACGLACPGTMRRFSAPRGHRGATGRSRQVGAQARPGHQGLRQHFGPHGGVLDRFVR